LRIKIKVQNRNDTTNRIKHGSENEISRTGNESKGKRKITYNNKNKNKLGIHVNDKYKSR